MSHVMESQSYNRTVYILKSPSDTAIEGSISLEAEMGNMCTVWPLAFIIHSVFTRQFWPIIYSLIRMSPFASSPNLSLCFIQYFLTQSVFSPHFSGLPPSLVFSILFCPSGLWDIRHCWEAYGLLIKKQGRMRPQLTRADICTALLVWIYRQEDLVGSSTCLSWTCTKCFVKKQKKILDFFFFFF